MNALANEKATDSIVHFFLDDYKFEALWNDPEPRIEKLKKFKAVLTPNFSIYTEMPLHCDKGMGSALGNGNISLPKNDSQLKHIFGNREGHVIDTPHNRQKLIELANDKSKYLGRDKYGNRWHATLNNEGNQWWVRFREQTINEGGMNTIPRTWDAETGLNYNPFK